MSDLLSVCMQDFLHGGKSELREPQSLVYRMDDILMLSCAYRE